MFENFITKYQLKICFFPKTIMYNIQMKNIHEQLIYYFF